MADTTVNTTATMPDINGMLHSNNDPITPADTLAHIRELFNDSANNVSRDKAVAAIKTWGDLQQFINKGTVKGLKFDGPKGMVPAKDAKVLGSANDVPIIGGGLKVGAQAIKALFTRKAAETVAEEGATAASKSGALNAVGKFARGHKKTTAAVVGVAGLSAVGNFMPDSKSKSTTTADSSALTPGGQTAQSTLDALYNSGAPSTTIAQALTDMQSQGTKLSQSDINTLQTRYQITGAASVNTAAATIGVYMGGGVPASGKVSVGSQSLPTGMKIPAPTAGTSGFTDLIKYKQSFPIGDRAALDAFYKKVTAAGVSISGQDPIGDLRKVWDNLGQQSMDASRQGHQITPDQMLAMASGFGGGSGNGGPTVNTTFSPTSKEDVKKMLNAQLQKLTGRTASNDDLEAFYNKVHGVEMKKGTKTVTTTVGKNSKTVVTPGYGQSEILAEAEKVAQQDPMYKQLQSANVFGDALSQALGVK